MGLGFEQPPSGYLSWDQLLLTSTSAEICKSARSLMTETTPLFYMFTSGTTGNLLFHLYRYIAAIRNSNGFLSYWCAWSLLPIPSRPFISFSYLFVVSFLYKYVNRKGLLMGHFSFLCGVDEDDIIYCTLPLYHFAGCCGVLMTLNIGMQVFTKRYKWHKWKAKIKCSSYLGVMAYCII